MGIGHHRRTGNSINVDGDSNKDAIKKSMLPILIKKKWG
jgi:hypothetical protein